MPEEPRVPGLSPPIKETQLLAGEIAPGWSIRNPLTIHVEPDEDGSFIVTDDELALYGVGASKEAAIADYAVSLVEYYEIVEAAATDHPPSIALLNRLGRYITRIPIRQSH
jgi:hypothetical protein